MKTALRIVSSHRGRPPKSGLRQRILDIGERVFAERAFHEVLMDDVARECDVAKGTLYLYFPAKRELYLAILFERMERLRQSLAGVAEDPSPPLERLRSTVIRLIEHRRRRLLLLLGQEQRLHPRETRQWSRRRRRISRIVQSILAQAVAAGDLRPIEPEVGEEMLFGLVRGLQVHRRKGVSTARLADRAMDLFLQGAGSRRGPRLAAQRRPSRSRP